MKKLQPLEKKVLNTIRIHGSLTKINLSEIVGLSVTKINTLINDFFKEGILEEIVGQSTGGRIPKLFKIADNLWLTMGIEITFHSINISIVDSNGNIISTLRQSKSTEKIDNIKFSDILKFGNEVLKSVNITWDNISAIGIGIIGLVDEKNGTCLMLPKNPKWRNFNVVDFLKEKTKINNIYLTDSVRAMALSEGRFGSCKNISNYILFYISEGLGTGIVINNNIVTGSRGIAGEIGHIFVGKSDRICSCGNYGCLEVMASGMDIVKKAKAAVDNGVFTSMSNLTDYEKSISLIVNAALKGDRLALNLIDEAAKYLARGIGIMMNLLDPQAIVLAGELVDKMKDIFFTKLINNIKTITLPWLLEDVNIYKSKLGENISTLGIATYALDRYLDAL